MNFVWWRMWKTEGKFAYNFPPEHYLTPAKHFNERLLNHPEKHASNSDYIFFEQFVLQQKTLSDKWIWPWKKCQVE